MKIRNPLHAVLAVGLGVAVAAGLAFGVAASGPSSIDGAAEDVKLNKAERVTGMTAFEAEILRLTNVERAVHKLSPVKWDAKPQVAADAHIYDISGNPCRFPSTDSAGNDIPGTGISHTGNNGSTFGERITAAQSTNASPLKYSAAAENLACGYTTPANFVKTWMESPGHRAAILTAGYTHLGVSVKANPNDGKLWAAQVFVQQRN